MCSYSIRIAHAADVVACVCCPPYFNNLLTMMIVTCLQLQGRLHVQVHWHTHEVVIARSNIVFISPKVDETVTLSEPHRVQVGGDCIGLDPNQP